MVTKKEAENSSFVYTKDARTGEIKRIAFPQDVQIGLSSSPKELMLTGRFSFSAVSYKIAPGATLTLKNDVVYASIEPTTISTLGVLNVALPSKPRMGQLVIIKDGSGTANTHNVVVRAESGIEIDNAPSQTIVIPYGAISVVWNGDNWASIAEKGGSSTATPAGANKQIQFNKTGVFGADSVFTYDDAIDTLSVPRLSGSLTRLATGQAYINAGTGINISTGSLGEIYIANTSTGATTLEWNERLTGAVDGVNTNFTLAYTPTTTSTIMLFLNGVLLEQGVGNDFTISGTTVTLAEAPLPDSKVTATYSR
jgi:hypothetical protein